MVFFLVGLAHLLHQTRSAPETHADATTVIPRLAAMRSRLYEVWRLRHAPITRSTAACLVSAFGRMTGYAKLVAVGVSEIGSVIVRVILRPQTGRPVRGAAMGKCNGEGLIDHGATVRKERHHLAIAR